MEDGFDPRAPFLAMPALCGINHERNQGVDGDEYSYGLAQISNPIAGGEEPSERKNENREVEQESGVSQISNDLPRQARAFGVVIGQQSEAEDLAQEAFLQVYRRAHQYQPDVAPFKTWFFAILSNLCRNALKRNRFLSAVELSPESLDAPAFDDPANDLADKEQRAAVARAIRKLPPNQRLALILCHYEELSYAEAANALDLSVKAVESLLVRAKRSLRQELSALRKKSAT